MLLNYIGLQGLGTTVPPSGLYVDHLEGVRLDVAKALREDNAQRDTTVKVWESIQRRAIARLESDLMTKLKGKFRMRGARNIARAGWRYADNARVLPSPNYRGLFVEYWRERFSELRLNYVQLWSQSATSTTLRVLDLVTGQQIYSVPWTLAAGLNRLELNLAPDTGGINERFFVCYESDTVETIYQDGLIQGGARSVLVNEAISPKLPNLVYQNLVLSTAIQGLVLDFTVNCSAAKFADSIKEQIKYALWYLLGSEFLAERLSSDEWNRVTLFNRDQSRELSEKYAKEYERVMLETLASLPRPDDECFCDDTTIATKWLV